MTLIELARKLRPYIERAAASLTDADALEAVQLFPSWAADTSVETGVRMQYGGVLYRCRQGHTTQTGWEPPAAPALWEAVVLGHSGTAADPIPYAAGMALEQGLYYLDGGVLYLCTRSSGMPVYHSLHDLIGLYVEEVTL